VEKRKELNEKLVKSLASKTLPQLTAYGGYSLTGLDPELSKSLTQVYDFKIRGWNVGMSLAHSFGQNQDRSELETAQADEIQARAQFQDQSDRLTEDVQTSLNDYRFNFDKLDLMKKIEKNRKEVEILFRTKFNNGRISIQDLLQAQERRRLSRYRSRLAESDMVLTRMQVDLAKGTYLSQFGITAENLQVLIGRNSN